MAEPFLRGGSRPGDGRRGHSRGTRQGEPQDHRSASEKDRLASGEVFDLCQHRPRVAIAQGPCEVGKPVGALFDQSRHPRLLAPQFLGRLARRVSRVLCAVSRA
jgi:hypothetical protein